MSTGFLITTLSGKLKRISHVISQHVLKKLYIYVSVNRNQPSIRNNEWVSEKIIDMYSSSSQLFPNLDVRIILNGLKLHEEEIGNIKDYNVDVVILPKNFNKENLNECNDYFKSLYVVYVDGLMEEEYQIKEENVAIYKNVVLGGTFDRLHTGHKILLSEALLRCSQTLKVGVTDIEMIQGKKLWELIQPCTERISAVEKFIKEVDRTVKSVVVPIKDVYGPSAYDPEMDMIVVSSETEKGAYKVNALRKEKGLKQLVKHVVKVVNDLKSTTGIEEEKISSSNLRIRLLGTYIRQPELNPDLPSKPYIIGLTGGIASGKSTISYYLGQLGAAVLDCDKLGHELYMCGTKTYHDIVEIFGKEILSEDGQINRRALGSVVFHDKDKLKTLNCLMWPAIYNKARQESERLYNEEKKEVVFMEAAVLLQAGWHRRVHEVWATIIPREEAISRLQRRNRFSQEEAILRLESQVPNTEIVANAHVVFCSLWSYEFTKSQVNKAWLSLQKSRK